MAAHRLPNSTCTSHPRSESTLTSSQRITALYRELDKIRRDGIKYEFENSFLSTLALGEVKPLSVL